MFTKHLKNATIRYRTKEVKSVLIH